MTEQFSLVPKSLNEAMELSKLLSQSDLVPQDYKGKPGNVLVAVQMGQELGIQPMQALQNIAVINGRPTVWGDLMLALVRGSGLLEYCNESVNGDTATCEVKRKGEPDPIVRTFSWLEAIQAGYDKKTGPWKTHRNRMLQMRARAFALRDGFADVLRGLQMREEVIDIPPADVVRVETPTKTETLRHVIDTKAEPLQSIADFNLLIHEAEDMGVLKQVGVQIKESSLSELEKKALRLAYQMREKRLQKLLEPVVEEAEVGQEEDVVQDHIEVSDAGTEQR